MADLSETHLEVSADPLRAVEEIRPVQGGCQSHLMRCSDDHYYVVKFPNNPQGRRVLVNELLCTSLAELLSLPVAHGAVVYVSEGLVRHSDGMYIEQECGRIPCEPGLCFGSRYVADPRAKAVYDFLPGSRATQVSNLLDFCGTWVFDIWTSNVDNRQVVFVPDGSTSYHAVMIDHGLCFGGHTWQFSNSAQRSLYMDKRVYEHVRGMSAFEPWLTILEDATSEDAIRKAANTVPLEWYGADRTGIDHLLEQLYARKNSVRDKIHLFGLGSPQIFPKWKRHTFCSCAPLA